MTLSVRKDEPITWLHELGHMFSELSITWTMLLTLWHPELRRKIRT